MMKVYVDLDIGKFGFETAIPALWTILHLTLIVGYRSRYMVPFEQKNISFLYLINACCFIGHVRFLLRHREVVYSKIPVSFGFGFDYL